MALNTQLVVLTTSILALLFFWCNATRVIIASLRSSVNQIFHNIITPHLARIVTIKKFVSEYMKRFFQSIITT